MSAKQLKSKHILLGVITGARGLRGDLWVKSFTADPASIADYGPLFDESGSRSFAFRLVGGHKDRLIGRIDGISDRTAAEALKGTRLYVSREVLPPTEPEEFYHTDLIGLNVRVAGIGEGDAVGVVRAVHDVGDDAVLEIRDVQGGALMVAFTRASVPEVDLEGGYVMIAALPVSGLTGPAPSKEEV